MDGKDPPIREMEYLGGVTVVDIGDYRVSRGMTRREHSACPHIRISYDAEERRIWCRDCERDVDPFDAFRGLVERYDKAVKRIKRDRAALEEAKQFTARLRATKVLEKAWRSRSTVPGCPTCHAGLFPKDFAEEQFPTLGKDYAEAVKAKRQGKKP